ncbi:NUDIX hydrolase [Actinosynnema pretiosum subsp. pretiosum]|uniref:NUDIX hydrolase n=3 Tax=Actinosynnema TaxID=40566 RepID=C6WAR7_ACTMD|nr:NUDIX hydrolase [Actinosynnema mirum DSM 43827]QUF07711.1 NUDIX hydrolase [Actinosynnema pretiosum subsp. pretiosum]
MRPPGLAGLTGKHLAAGVLFRDRDGRVLLVGPSYKADWEIPGGAVEVDESPWAAASRELGEELGWTRPVGRLLVVDFHPARDRRPETVAFVFDGGLVSEDDLEGLGSPDGELRSVALRTVEQARALVLPWLAGRLVAALEVVDGGGTALCEVGERVA